LTPPPDEWELEALEIAHRIVRDRPNRPRRGPSRARLRTRRFASSLAFITLFFAGAALSAGAGESFADLVEAGTGIDITSAEESTTSAETTTQETTTAAGEVTEPVAEEPAPPEGSAGVPPPSEPPAPAPPAAAAPPATDGGAPADSPSKTSTPTVRATELELETQDGGSATVWLYRVLPDPTPPAARLSPAFARMLRLVSARADVDWALVLGVVRARGGQGRVPASATEIQALADQLAVLNPDERPWRAIRIIAGRRSLANRAIALSRYNRAVRLRALVTGLEAATARLERRVLKDDRLDIYAGGRVDVEQGRIDVRTLVLMLYMAEAYGHATVSSLETGHRLYSRPGVVSAHIYGLAVDIAGLANRPIYGNQEPGGLTEKAVRNILRLPAEVQPQQVISLLGLGGPSFPLGDHGDHIHVGY
jgi:hypothetical protein